MISKTLVYSINDREVKLDVKAEHIVPGKDNVLYVKDGPSIHAPWERDGYIVTNFLYQKLFDSFYSFVYDYIVCNLKKIRSFNTSEFTLDTYHKFVDDKEHLAFLKSVAAGRFGISGISLSKLPFSYKSFDDFVSLVCNKKFTCKKTFYKVFTSNHFWLRIVRPNSNDNNPPHRDNHLMRNRKIVNIYAPIAGSNENSSLPIIPGSHFWSDSDLEITKGKAYINGIKFTNPAIVSSKNELKMITPNPQFGQLMLFTPYAIHGGGRNFNKDLTRISLEMRFWPV